MLSSLLGGIGLFLLGMLLMTDGLKAAAGDALKRILVRFTGRPVLAFCSGMVVTAMVQSSSATTLATIGFVSAGLLTFSQAIGVVMGGSVGTTTTGWLVALLGLKLSVGKLALPLIGVGALARLTLKGRWATLGLALAGFGLIFVGIDTLQQGMSGLAERVQPDSFPRATLVGRLLLVLIGILITVVMQSSSAAIATTLTAFHSNTLDLNQALALVVGASVGTTITAALASIGASVPARRTALAHILFNTIAGVLAFFLIPLFLWVVAQSEARSVAISGTIWVAVFHTGFTVIAAAFVLPMADRFAGVVTRLIPDQGAPLTRYLDRSLLHVPEVAVEAVRRTLVDSINETLENLNRRLAPEKVQAMRSTLPVRNALGDARGFLSSIPPFQAKESDMDARLAVVHTLDHMDELMDELGKAPPAGLLVGNPSVRAAKDVLIEAVQAAFAWAKEDGGEEAIDRLGNASKRLAELRREGREATLRETAYGGLSPAVADQRLDTVRWMDTVGYHLWRSVLHLHGASEKAATGAKDSAAPSPAKAE